MTPTVCKICAIPIVVDIDTECPEEWRTLALKCATCNPCADARVRTNKLAFAAERFATRLNMARVVYSQSSRSPEQKETYQKESRTVAEALEVITKKYTKVLAEYYGVIPEWSAEMVQIITDSPWNCLKMLRAYRLNLAKQLNKPYWSH